MGHIQPRGQCPVCQRDVALLSDNTVARPHLHEGVPCAGYGLEGQPYPPVVPAPQRITVRRSEHTGRWKVLTGERLAYLVDDFDTACRRAGQLADRARERAVEATTERFPPLSDLEREVWAA